MTHPHHHVGHEHGHEGKHGIPVHRPGLLTLLGPMPILLTLASVVTVTAAVLSTRAFDAAAASAERTEELDRRAREGLLGKGFTPDGTEVTAGVEAMLPRAAFSLPLSHGTVTARPPSRAKLEAAKGALAKELGRYPKGFLRKAKLRRVIFCEDLEEGGRSIPSLPNYASTLLVDADASPAFLARLVHHEVFHFVDFADDGLVVVDPAWEKLNPADFRYEGGGRTIRDPEASAPTGPDGFVTRYATASLEEDKAEIFSWLMNDHALLAARSRGDTVLAAKVARIDAIVRAFFPTSPAPYGSWP